MSLAYQQGSTDPAVIAGQYQFSTTSSTPIPVAQLKIRYYFSGEETSTLSPHVYAAALNGGTGGYRPLSSTLTIVALPTPVTGADTYAELSFSGALTLEAGATGSITWDIQPTNYNAPNQTQSNDYSYNAAATTFTVSNHIAIYQGSTLVWGCVPQ